MASENLIVLLIDDQPFVGEAIRRLLATDTTIDFFCCHEPRNGEARARELAPDVILLDLMMPEVDGLTLLGLLKANPQTANIRTIVLSGDDDAGARQRAADAGANGFLVKLPGRDELIAAINGGAIGERRRRDGAQTLDPGVLASFRELAPDRPEFTATLVDQFVHEAESMVEQIRIAVRDLDADTLRSATHRLKGACQTIGAGRLAALSGQMEGHAGRNLRAAVAAALMTEIDQAFRELQDALVSADLNQR